jgi:hypothetical protein
MSSPSQLLEPPARVFVEGALDGGTGFRRRGRAFLPELPQEGRGRNASRLLARGGAHRPVGRDDGHWLRGAVVCREALDEVVRVLGEADVERSDGRVRAGAVEDHDPAGPLQRDVTREAVDELVPVTEVACVQNVVAVEEEEHGAKDAHMEAERTYLAEVAKRLSAILGEELVGVYAGGSYALAGYEPGRSDLDVAAVVRASLPDGAAAEIVGAVGHESLPCPARKLELVVYSSAAAQSQSAEPSLALNLNTGPGELRVDLAPQPGEGHWSAIDRSVLAGHGVPLFGPPAAEVFASPTRADLLPLLAQTLRWYRDNEPKNEAALSNAGRSLRFARTGSWVPKAEFREWASSAPPDALDRAIAELEG